MIEPPENPHERLNRELARMRIRSPGLWGGWALLICTIGLFGFLTLNVPIDGTFVWGKAQATQPLLTETGATQVLRVTIEGRAVDMRLPSHLVHPIPGDMVCLLRATRAITRVVTYDIAPRIRCEG